MPSPASTSGPVPGPPLELLAPAGDFACLEAALEAGADAVYLGLTSLNARRRARNFSAGELSRACALAHRTGRRIYLTLNVDLAGTELAEAARILELAARERVDAVLVRDPALLALRRAFPELAYHLSTQTCMASRADVEAARELGASRVVLARELSLEEIRAASSVEGIQTEVFAQGALCFSVSGRCLLASWVGGRSGNRGQCTSPCRVPWTVDGAPAGTPLSMHDLSVVTRLRELAACGVRALKIEGRLKTAAWVRAAVALYRRALDALSASVEENLEAQAQALGAYTGRRLTCGYLDGRRTDLTGIAGRERAAADGTEAVPAGRPAADSAGGGYSFRIELDKRIRCRFAWGEAEHCWELPRAEVKRPDKAVPVSKLLEALAEEPIDGVRAAILESNAPDALLVPRSANGISAQVAASVRRSLRARKALEVTVRAPAQALLSLAERRSGSFAAARPDRARLAAGQVASFLAAVEPGSGIVVEGLDDAGVEELVASRPARLPVVAALPAVWFEAQRARLERLVGACARLRVPVEVNSWGGWELARRAGARMEGGPGLGVLNALAARELGERGCQCVTASVEADAAQLADLLRASPVPCSVVVFGRPALMTTRVALPPSVTSGLLEDRREVRLFCRRTAEEVVELRPVEPFEWRTATIPGGARHLVVDLVGSGSPVAEWSQPSHQARRFNLERTLA